MAEVKQVIVFRKDLLKGEHAVRKGKIAAQVAHASLCALLKYAVQYDYHDDEDGFRLRKKLNSILFQMGSSISGLTGFLQRYVYVWKMMRSLLPYITR